MLMGLNGMSVNLKIEMKLHLQSLHIETYKDIKKGSELWVPIKWIAQLPHFRQSQVARDIYATNKMMRHWIVMKDVKYKLEIQPHIGLSITYLLLNNWNMPQRNIQLPQSDTWTLIVIFFGHYLRTKGRTPVIGYCTKTNTETYVWLNCKSTQHTSLSQVL